MRHYPLLSGGDKKMQHTISLNLNLIEKDDTFSPDPLNENAEWSENAGYLTGVAVRAEAHARDALAERVTALNQRVTVLEAKKIVAGTYSGTGKEQTISLGFTPFAAMICSPSASQGYCDLLAVSGLSAYDANGNTFSIVDGGFQLGAQRYPQLNAAGATYMYIAFG